ncbi:MAG: ABC transporter ATP-binding protein [Candidatus Omnitrophota bacterium]|jgi:subfamily B ATP-binding cassette protein MsbA
MKRFALKIKNTYRSLVRLKDFLRRLQINLTGFVFSAFFSLGAAFFEGLSAVLLILIAKGIFRMDFGFVRETQTFRVIIARLPRISSMPNLSIFAVLLGMVFMVSLAKHILKYSASLEVVYQVRRFSHNLRKLIFNRYLSFGKLFFDRSSEGYLHNVLIGFTNTIAISLIGLQDIISGIFMAIAYLTVMFMISWRLTFFTIIVFPVLYYSLGWLINKIKKTSRFYADSRSRLSRKISNITSCIPLVKAYNKEEDEKKEFADLSGLVARLEFSIDKKQNLINPIQEIITLVAILLLVSAVAFIIIKKRSGEMADFLVFFYLIKRCTSVMAGLNQFRGMVAGVSGPISEISGILNDKDKFFIPGGDKEFNGLKEAIDFSQLSFSYIPGIPVLQDITFSLKRGQITAIVGPTGSGKTTLINLILRLYDNPPASVFIDGTDIREFTLKSLRQHMALVSQDILLFNDTLAKNIAYGLEGVSEEMLADAAKKARVYDFIMSLPDKFNTIIGDRGIRLSGGEKQRVAIARALVKGSEIFILDEATSSLDTKTERLIQEAIAEAIKDKTTIVIAHRLSTIKNADKIVVIEKGRLVEQGTLAELLERKGKFYQYWEEQKFF